MLITKFAVVASLAAAVFMQMVGKEKHFADIKVGRFTYAIYVQRLHLPREGTNTDYYVVYKKGDRSLSLCSAFKNRYTIDGNRMVSKSSYQYTDSTITFKDYSLDGHYMKADSITKTYRVEPQGKLKLIEYIEYKNGVPSKNYYPLNR